MIVGPAFAANDTTEEGSESIADDLPILTAPDPEAISEPEPEPVVEEEPIVIDGGSVEELAPEPELEPSPEEQPVSEESSPEPAPEESTSDLAEEESYAPVEETGPQPEEPTESEETETVEQSPESEQVSEDYPSEPPTVIETPGGDDVSYEVPLSGPVMFCGAEYETIYATTNAVITFGEPDGTFWDYPETPSISMGSQDWVAYPVRGDEHFIISYTDEAFQVDMAARPFADKQTPDVSRIILSGLINEDRTIDFNYYLENTEQYEDNLRFGVRTPEGDVQTLEEAGFTESTEAPTEEGEFIEPAPEEQEPVAQEPAQEEEAETPSESEVVEEEQEQSESQSEPIQEIPEVVVAPQPTPPPYYFVPEPVVPPEPIEEPVDASEPEETPEEVESEPEPEPAIEEELTEEEETQPTPSPEPEAPVESPEPTPSTPVEEPQTTPEESETPSEPEQVEPNQDEVVSEEPQEEPQSVLEETTELLSVDPQTITEEQIVHMRSVAIQTLNSVSVGTEEYTNGLELLAVAAEADDPELPEELAAVPVVGAVAGQVLEVMNDLGNVGADMAPKTRETSEKVVVAAVIVGNIAMTATQTAASAAVAAARRP